MTDAPATGSRARCRRRSDDGFSLIEVAVTAAVLAIVMIPIVALLAVSAKAVTTGRNDVIAASLASQQLQAAAATPFASLAFGRSVHTQVVGGITYTIAQDVEWVGRQSTANNCTTGPVAGSPIVRVIASVTWPSSATMGTPVSEAATISPALSSTPSSTGLALPVLAAPGGAGVPGVQVTVTGPITATLTTGLDGCAYFPSLTAGSYTVSLAEPGFVSPQEASSPTVSATVTAGATDVLSPTFYAQAGTVAVSATTPTTLTPATGLAYSVGNTGLQPLGWVAPAGGTTQLSLYPSPSGYSVWAGDCEDSDPQGVAPTTGTPYYPGAPTPTAVPAASGQTSSTTVLLSPLPIEVVNSKGAPVGSASLSAIPTGPDCQNPVPTYGLVTTASNGTSTTGVPLGQLQVNATAGGLAGTADVWVTPSGLETSSGAPITGPLVVTVA